MFQRSHVVMRHGSMATTATWTKAAVPRRRTATSDPWLA